MYFHLFMWKFIISFFNCFDNVRIQSSFMARAGYFSTWNNWHFWPKQMECYATHLATNNFCFLYSSLLLPNLPSWLLVPFFNGSMCSASCKWERFLGITLPMHHKMDLVKVLFPHPLCIFSTLSFMLLHEWESFKVCFLHTLLLFPEASRSFWLVCLRL